MQTWSNITDFVIAAQADRTVSGRSHTRHLWVLCALVAVLAMCALSEAVHARSQVLIIFDEDKELPGLAVINRNLQQVLRAELRAPVEFYSESLNLSRFDSVEYQDVLREYFHDKYKRHAVDLIIAVMEPSLDFLLRNADTLFPGVPIVFCGANPGDAQMLSLPENVTGVLMKRNFAPSLEVALRLQPDIRNVFLIGGTSRFDRQVQATARRDLEGFGTRLSITWLTEMPMPQLLDRVSALPANSVIYYLTLFADGAGEAFVPHEALSRIAQRANAPVYVAVDQYIGLGAIGGHVYSVETLGQQAAAMGVRVLRGESPSSIPVSSASAYKNLFDWRQLDRWGIDQGLLPQDSQIEYQPMTVWYLYKWYIVAGTGLFLLQSGLVIGLFMSRAQRRRAEVLRKQSEERRLHAEEEVRLQRDELAHALRVTTLGEMTASFTHELGQPLAAIGINAAAARQMIADHAPISSVSEVVEDVIADARRGAETLHRLRALFRKQPPSCRPVEINSLVRDVLRLLEYETRRRGIFLKFTGGGESDYVMGDAVQLQQVLINLLINAEEAISASGKNAREIHVEIRRPTSGRLEILISDSGTGVNESELEQIFEQFVSSKPQGLGMGLTISRSIIQAHGGRIWATPNEPCGLTMHVELPEASAATDSQEPQLAQRVASTH